jgi:hypothetical protein
MNMLVVVDRDKQQVVLSDALGGGTRTYSLPGDVRITHLFLSGKEILEGPVMVRFLPNGSAEIAEIVLQAETGAVLKVVTDPLTGGARIDLGQGGQLP